MTLIEIFLVVAILALLVFGVRWLLGLGGIVIPDVIYILICVILVLLIVSGEWVPKLGLGGH